MDWTLTPGKAPNFPVFTPLHLSLSEITEEALCSVKETQVGKWLRTNKCNLCKNNKLHLSEVNGGGGGIRNIDLSIYKTNTYDTKIDQNDASSGQNNALGNSQEINYRD